MLMLVALLAQAAAQEALPQKPFNPCLEAGTRETVVFIGALKQPPDPPEPAFFGTGFLIEVDGIPYLVTAKHVIQQYLDEGKGDGALVAAFNLKSGRGTVQSLAKIRAANNVGWVFAAAADIGCFPFPLGPDFNVRTVPRALFLPPAAAAELQDVFFVSFHPGLGGTDRITPILRRGMVSLITEKQLYLDAFVFPGNSGSPVFTKPSPVSFMAGGTMVGDQLGCRLVGLVGAYLPYQEVAVSLQTKRPRVVFEENTGLAEVTTADQIDELIQSEDFQKQHRRILKALGR